MADLVRSLAGRRPCVCDDPAYGGLQSSTLVAQVDDAGAGHVACLGHGAGGHTSWHCRTCDAVVYRPPLKLSLHRA
jgi:hypothetical protein